MPESSEPTTLAALATREGPGRELLVATDFDGTLSDIASRPDEALLREDARLALQKLVKRSKVAVLSGRELSDLRAKVAIDGIALAGEHGGDLLLPGGDRRNLDLPPSERGVLDAFARYADLLLAGTGGQVERKRLAVAAHTRRVAEQDQKRLEEALLLRATELSKGAGLDAIPGKRVVELRAHGASKDFGLARLRTLFAPESFVIAIGDDVTDEDLFREAARSGGVTVRVGPGDSSARFRLEGPKQVAEFLALLAS